MARAQNNVAINGVRGAVGKTMVYREINGQTVVSAMPKPTQTASPFQVHIRSRFKRASDRIKEMFIDPEVKLLYVRKAKFKKLPNARTAAMSDVLLALKKEEEESGVLAKLKAQRDATPRPVVKKEPAQSVSMTGSLTEQLTQLKDAVVEITRMIRGLEIQISLHG